MEIRMITENEKREFFDLLWYCHPETKTWHEAEEKVFYHKECFAGFEEGKIVAGMQIRTYKVNFHGKTVTMGGIEAVATAPEIRYQNKTADFMRFAILYMKENNIILSALNPFSYGFYRKYGWETTCERLNYEIEFPKLKQFLTQEYTYEKLDLESFNEQEHLFNKFFSKYNGCVVYDERTFRRRVEIIHAFGYHIYSCQNTRKEPCGYIFYRISEGKFIIQEMGFKDSKAQQALWGYVYRHNSSCEKVVAFLPPDDLTRKYMNEPRMSVKINSDMMYRIIDFEKTLIYLSVDWTLSLSFIMKINDREAPWNEGVYEIKAENGNITAVLSNREPDIEIGIEQLTQLMMGYLSIDELVDLGKVTVFNDKAIRTLDYLFRKSSPYIQERF
ncbi:MAG: GNAT family N-acetyltransferase [Clostridia bacterium]|nr:GNAT family N-acetyltransferase [Clostridia bacterium]